MTAFGHEKSARLKALQIFQRNVSFVCSLDTNARCIPKPVRK